MSRVLRVSLAVGSDGFTAVLPGGETLTVAVQIPLGVADDPSAALRQGLGRLEDALRRLAETPAEIELRAHLVVALLPPLSEARIVELPPLRPEETDAVLRREAPRHFLGRGRSLVVAGERFGAARQDAAPSPVLTTAASRPLLDALHRAAEARGWKLERIVPAHAAWIHALQESFPATAEEDAADAEPSVRLLVAVQGDTAHLVRMTGRRMGTIRRVPAGDAAALVEAAGNDPGRALLLADEGAPAGLAAALKNAGWVLAPPTGETASARVAAAVHAQAALPELVPAALVRVRAERSRRATIRLLAASVVVLAASAVVHLWGTAQAYRSVQTERAELRQAVRPALAARDSLDDINVRLDGLRSLGRESARWTFSLVELAMLLPSDTHLISLRAAGDTAVFEAVGGRAGDALAALRAAPTLRDVRIEGQIQRDLEGGTTSRERFTLSAILAPEAAAAAASGAVLPAALRDSGGAP